MKLTKEMKQRQIKPNYMKHNIYSSNDLKRYSKGHFFSPDTMRFFNSRVCLDVYPGKNLVFFVTSEKYDYKSPRLYTVRSLNPKTGEINTVGDFQGYPTKIKACSAALDHAVND